MLSRSTLLYSAVTAFPILKVKQTGSSKHFLWICGLCCSDAKRNSQRTAASVFIKEKKKKSLIKHKWTATYLLQGEVNYIRLCCAVPRGWPITKSHCWCWKVKTCCHLRWHHLQQKYPLTSTALGAWKRYSTNTHSAPWRLLAQAQPRPLKKLIFPLTNMN